MIGGHCSSTAVFVNAHHSIGIRALVLFGTTEQKEKWLGPLARGEKLAAFALTETEAGSDASNVQTTATPIDGGRAYRLNGSKRYITNGGIADVLTVMAKTPDPKGGEPKVTAFLVTPDTQGFEVVEPRMPKCGIRGTATAKLAFHDMVVPAENILGPLGKGLRVALTVLDFGRTTFGASCAGAAKTCLKAAVKHAVRRKQFGRGSPTWSSSKRKSPTSRPSPTPLKRQPSRPPRSSTGAPTITCSKPRSSRSIPPRCSGKAFMKRSRFTGAKATSTTNLSNA